MSTPDTRAAPALQPDLLAQECELWQRFIGQRCSLHFPENRLRFLRQSLWGRMGLHGIQSYREYYNYVTCDPAGEAEWQALLELLLNHETGFFRHPPSFAALTEQVLPVLLHERPRENTVTIWSAGCSMGQEAYSLAMTFLDFTAPPSALHRARRGGEAPEGWQVRVIGSDISLSALDRARQGQYKPHELRSLPDYYRQHYFTVVRTGPNVVYQVVPQVRTVVQFSRVNLHDLDSSPLALSPAIGAVDIIFCQNVLIYFSQEDRAGIVQRLCQYLRPGGYLFLGPTEVVGLHLPGMQPVRLPDVLIYQRTP